MKLRNKETGEIVSLDGEITYDNKVRLLKHYNSLAELCEEWEDYEEPKEYWYIGYKNIVRKAEKKFFSDYADNSITTKRIETGNYFETKEEAERAVEKLKAWKRLKDRGFKFGGYELVDGTIRFTIDLRPRTPDDLYPDLDLLFGG